MISRDATTSSTPTRAVLQHQPDEILRHNDLVQPRNMRVDKLAVMVYLAGEVRIVFVGRLEDDLWMAVSMEGRRTWPGLEACLGAIGELMRRQIYFAKGSLSNQPAEGVVADRGEVIGREFAAEAHGQLGTSHGLPEGRDWNALQQLLIRGRKLDIDCVSTSCYQRRGQETG